MMNGKYELIDYTIKSLVEMLMTEYDATYDWSLQVVMGSQTYKRLLENKNLLNEGDLFLFEMLQTELKIQGIISF